jgi:hypothetical protein
VDVGDGAGVDDEGPGEPDDGVPADAAVARCPPDLEARAEQTCRAPGRRCDYGEAGDCPCAVLPIVQGVARAPGETPPPPRTIWDCRPRVRDDGCPGRPPSGPCSREGQRCGYRAHEPQAVGTNGTWQLLPPRPVP